MAALPDMGDHDEDDRRPAGEAPPDDEWHARRACDDLSAFAPLYDRYHDPIYGFCLRRLGDHDRAGDATSLVFSRAMTSIDRFRGGSFRAWLFAIARNVVIDATRRQRYHAGLDDVAEVAGPGPSPEDLAVAGDERRRVAAALARLTPDQRDVVELRAAGLSGPEVATALGLSLSSVKSLQFRAYARLRVLLRDPEGSDAR